MALQLKSIIKSRLKDIISYYAPHMEISATHARGVRYFVPVTGINMLWGAMNTYKEGRRYHKHIIVRRVPRNGGQLLQLYTYHFPTRWSEGCIANRNLIKEAQRRAHALEHDYSAEGTEWRIRFFKHYFRVFKCKEKPEPGFKPYSRFYQYVFVAIYRELQAAKARAEEANANAKANAEDVSFEPILNRPFKPVLNRSFSPVSRRLFLHSEDFNTLHRSRIAIVYSSA